MTCTLSNFKLPESDVRLVTFEDTVFKIKLRFRDNQSHKINAENK